MKTPYSLKSSFLLFTIALILLLMASSCSAPEPTDELYDHIGLPEVTFNMVFIAPNSVPLRLKDKANIRPTYGVVQTDKGGYQFDIVNSVDTGFYSSNFKMTAGKYFVEEVSLYNAVGEKVMYMEERPSDTTYGSEVVSWVGETYTFDIEGFTYPMQVFYN